MCSSDLAMPITDWPTELRLNKPEPINLPDSSGHFGPYGGVFVSETLVQALEQLSAAYDAARKDPAFLEELAYDLKHYVGRPSPIYHCKRWSDLLGGAQIYLKREDLNHTGAHKVNNTIGQALLARRMGKPRVIAETGDRKSTRLNSSH